MLLVYVFLFIIFPMGRTHLMRLYLVYLNVNPIVGSRFRQKRIFSWSQNRMRRGRGCICYTAFSHLTTFFKTFFHHATQNFNFATKTFNLLSKGCNFAAFLAKGAYIRITKSTQLFKETVMV